MHPVGALADRAPPVWNARASGSISGRRKTVGATKPAAEVALVGEAARGGHRGRGFFSGQEPARLREPDLYQVGVRRHPVGRSKRAGELKPVRRAHGLRQRIGPDPKSEAVVQMIPGAARQSGVCLCGRARQATVEMWAEPVQHGIQRRIASERLGRAMQNVAGGPDGGAERIVLQKR